ncbi:hypothetical protein TrRE_jg3585 [Triparma retinervis]|uniref:Fumarylacetoacetase-like C-terminal domain-containing protein n=1 Tax=Triparma retinervis TaxID=2557542 RepID=A0A9W7G7G0_9STRA|nr:hypothetical protein TrRE_jg3585 [Triparma retinervis]
MKSTSISAAPRATRRLFSSSSLLFPPTPPPLINVFSTPGSSSSKSENPVSSWPVRRVYCIGRNYAAHASEMGDDPSRSSPFFFQKPPQAIVDTTASADPLRFPRMTSSYHYEAELVLGIGGSSAPSLSPSGAMSLIHAIGVGCDLTRRDLQDVAKEKRRPWDDGKGVEDSGPQGCPVRTGGLMAQPSHPRRRPPTPLAATISQYHDLHAGDIIFTGTPAGVGKIERGENVLVTLDLADGGRLSCDFACE